MISTANHSFRVLQRVVYSRLPDTINDPSKEKGSALTGPTAMNSESLMASSSKGSIPEAMRR